MKATGFRNELLMRELIHAKKGSRAGKGTLCRERAVTLPSATELAKKKCRGDVEGEAVQRKWNYILTNAQRAS